MYGKRIMSRKHFIMAEQICEMKKEWLSHYSESNYRRAQYLNWQYAQYCTWKKKTCWLGTEPRQLTDEYKATRMGLSLEHPMGYHREGTYIPTPYRYQQWNMGVSRDVKHPGNLKQGNKPLNFGSFGGIKILPNV